MVFVDRYLVEYAFVFMAQKSFLVLPVMKCTFT